MIRSSTGRCSSTGINQFAQLAGEYVVEVLHRPGARARLSVRDGPTGRCNVLPRVQEAEQSVEPVHRALDRLVERPGEDRPGRQPPVAEQLVVAPEAGVMDARLRKGEPFDRLPGDRQFGMRAMQLLDGGKGLELQESIVRLQRCDENVHRRPAGDPRQRRGDSTPHPLVLGRVLQTVPEQVDHRFAVPHQRLPRAALQSMMAEQRHQLRREPRVRLVERADAPHRLVRNLGVRVVEQHGEQIAGAGVRRPAGGGGQIAPDTGCFRALVTGERSELALDDVSIGLLAALRENHGGGGGDVRVAVVDQDPCVRQRVSRGAGRRGHGWRRFSSPAPDRR